MATEEIPEKDDKELLMELIAEEAVEGPLEILQTVALSRERIHIKCHTNTHMIGTLVAFDKHFNMLLIDIEEKIRSRRKYRNGKRRTVSKFRSYNKIFLRGENVIYVRRMDAGQWKRFMISFKSAVPVETAPIVV